jgi:hypothetical protein
VRLIDKLPPIAGRWGSSALPGLSPSPLPYGRALSISRAGRGSRSLFGDTDGQSWDMKVPFDEIDPEAILIRMRVETSRWHIIDEERELTFCGLFLSQGFGRRPFSETDVDLRCERCVARFSKVSPPSAVA